MTDMTLPGIPASLDREELLAFLRRLGLDPNVITSDGVQISGNAVTCQVMARNADGKWLADPKTNSIRKHTVHIPIVPPIDA